MRPEEKLHFAICDYIRLRYPSVMFISESSGIRTSMGLAAKLKRTRSNHTHLDLYILEPVKKFSGLILELKAKSIFKKNGELLKNDHHLEQQKTIQRLLNRGYAAQFVCSFDEAVDVINRYMNGDYEV